MTSKDPFQTHPFSDYVTTPTIGQTKLCELNLSQRFISYVDAHVNISMARMKTPCAKSSHAHTDVFMQVYMYINLKVVKLLSTITSGIFDPYAKSIG